MIEMLKTHRDECHQVILLIDQVGQVNRHEVKETCEFTKKFTNEIIEALLDFGIVGGEWNQVEGEWVRSFYIVGEAARDYIDTIHKYNRSKKDSYSEGEKK